MNLENFIELIIKNPKLIPSLIPELTNKYKPSIYVIGKEIQNILKDYANNTEYFEINAKIKKQQYDAYINAGFNEDQAIAFIINDNLRLFENIKKYENKINVNTKR